MLVGDTVEHRFRISAEDMQAFGTLSGDWNPVHSDAAFAASKGYQAPIVYGGLLLAKISGLLGMSLPGRECLWCGVKTQFCGPLYVGEDARLTGTVTQFSPSTGLGTVQIEIGTGERLVVRGKAEVRVPVT